MGSGSKASGTQQRWPQEGDRVYTIKSIAGGIHGLKFTSNPIINTEAIKTFLVLFYEPEPLEPPQPSNLSRREKSLLAASRATILLDTAIALKNKPHGSVMDLWRAGAKELLQKKYATAHINLQYVAAIMNAIVRARQEYLKKPKFQHSIEDSFGPFLNALDHWITVRDHRPGMHHGAGGGDSQAFTQAGMHFSNRATMQKKDETPSSTMSTNKELREDQSASDSTEPALAASNERVDSLEADNQLLRAHNASQAERIQKLTEDGEKMWFELRRQVNPIQRARGQPEWEEDDMDKYLDSLDHFSYGMEEDGEL